MESDQPQIRLVSVTDVAERLKTGAYLIDVRERKEWNAGHLAGADFKPMSLIEDWYEDLPRDREIIVYCRSGDRSFQVVKALTEQAGFVDIYNMTGGTMAWAEAGLDITIPQT